MGLARLTGESRFRALAGRQLNWLAGQAGDYPSEQCFALLAMAEALYSFDLLANGQGGPVQSASIGSVSVSYSGPAGQSLDLSPRGREKELYRCASQYLDIYRGVG